MIKQHGLHSSNQIQKALQKYANHIISYEDRPTQVRPLLNKLNTNSIYTTNIYQIINFIHKIKNKCKRLGHHKCGNTFREPNRWAKIVLYSFSVLYTLENSSILR